MCAHVGQAYKPNSLESHHSSKPNVLILVRVWAENIWVQVFSNKIILAEFYLFILDTCIV